MRERPHSGAPAPHVPTLPPIRTGPKPARSHPLKSQALCTAWQPPDRLLVLVTTRLFLRSPDWVVDGSPSVSWQFLHSGLIRSRRVRIPAFGTRTHPWGRAGVGPGGRHRACAAADPGGGASGDWAADRLSGGTHKCRYVRVLRKRLTHLWRQEPRVGLVDEAKP